MRTLTKVLHLLIGKDDWASEIHRNKNIVFAEGLKTQAKSKELHKILYNRDTAYFIGRAMGAIHE